MNLKRIKIVPVVISFTVLTLVCFLVSLRFWSPGTTGGLERLESITYDFRAQYALKFNPPIATNLGFIFISDKTIETLREGSIGGKQYSLYWPREVYGRVVRELKTQGAKGVAFDILFADLRGGDPVVELPPAAGGEKPKEKVEIPSDIYFIQEMKKAGNVVLASTSAVKPDDAFRLNAAAMGDISAESDMDGVLRHAKPFYTYRYWALNIEEQIRDNGQFWLDQAIVKKELIAFKNDSTNVYYLPLNEKGEFNLVKLIRDFMGEEFTTNYFKEVSEQFAKPYEEIQVWHMGITMAAIQLGLDLKNARMDYQKHELFIPGTNGVSRTIPLDQNGYFYIDWCLPVEDQRLARDGFEFVMLNDVDREEGHGNEIPPADATRFANRLVFVGSTATGNELTDRGTTPLGKNTFLISKHWNIANSVLLNRFIRRASLRTELSLIIAMGLLSTLVTLGLKPPWSSILLIVAGGTYVWWAVDVFVESRSLLPIVAPLGGSLLFNHISLMGYQVMVENKERQRIKGMFSRLVSPNVVNELLKEKEMHLGGQRRRITVFFSDVRGFTTMTDEMQAYADNYVKEYHLEGAEAEAFRDLAAAETLETVNLYLATIADQIKKHDGTLDKYIGDCVMAFWGAPTPNEAHAVSCVRSTIDAQLAMHQLNIGRAAQNRRIEATNMERTTRGEPPLPLKRLLVMGSGVNTGTAIVGLMGSEQHIFNFTVFGRSVNIASRLESVSGRGHIIIGEPTFRDIQKYDPALAATCEEWEPVTVKGIAEAVQIWEVPWRMYLSEDQRDAIDFTRPADGADEKKAAPSVAKASATGPKRKTQGGSN